MKLEDIYHDMAHTSLREYLVPVDKWRETFMEIECAGEFVCNLPPIPEQMTKRPYYIMPYQYPYPIWLEIMKTSDKPVTFDDISDRWVKALADRYSKCLSNAVAEDVVSAIDDVHGIGAVIVRSTGQIIPFDYSEITGMRFEMLPAEVEMALVHEGGIDNEETTDNICDILDELYGLYDLNYSLMYGPHVVRSISDSETFQCRFPGRVYLSPEDISKLGMVVNQLISMKAKVIPVV